jgi:hypothetical protein
VLADVTGLGRLGGSVEYRVRVGQPGSFRVAYRVSTYHVTRAAAIELTAGGRSLVTVVSTGGPWRTVWVAEPVTLPAGEHTIRLAVPPGGQGWLLNSLTIRRDGPM